MHRRVALPAALVREWKCTKVYLGLSGLAGTFAVALLYRLLFAHRPGHETFMSPAELRRPRSRATAIGALGAPPNTSC